MEAETFPKGQFFTIDFGVNFAKKSVGEVQEIMEDAYAKGVSAIVCISNSPLEWSKNIEIIQKVSGTFMTLGCHPHNASYFRNDHISRMEEILKDFGGKIIAIGECGLDYFRMFSPKEAQKRVFRKQVEFAQKHNMKMYLHCRGSEENPDDAFEDLMNILSEFDYYSGIIHCFTGTLDQALAFTSKGFQLGITGFIYDRRRNSDLVEVLKDIRIAPDMLLVETDAPYMGIHPNKTSSPEDTGRIVSKISELKKEDWVDIGQKLYMNAVNFINGK